MVPVGHGVALLVHGRRLGSGGLACIGIAGNLPLRSRHTRRGRASRPRKPSSRASAGASAGTGRGASNWVPRSDSPSSVSATGSRPWASCVRDRPVGAERLADVPPVHGDLQRGGERHHRGLEVVVADPHVLRRLPAPGGEHGARLLLEAVDPDPDRHPVVEVDLTVRALGERVQGVVHVREQLAEVPALARRTTGQVGVGHLGEDDPGVGECAVEELDRVVERCHGVRPRGRGPSRRAAARAARTSRTGTSRRTRRRA